MRRNLANARYTCGACTFKCTTISGLKRHKMACKKPRRRIIRRELAVVDDGVESCVSVEAGLK